MNLAKVERNKAQRKSNEGEAMDIENGSSEVRSGSNPTLSIADCVTLGKLLKFSSPLLMHVQNGNNT